MIIDDKHIIQGNSKMKKVFSIIMCLVLMLSISSQSFAQDVDDYEVGQIILERDGELITDFSEEDQEMIDEFLAFRNNSLLRSTTTTVWHKAHTCMGNAAGPPYTVYGSPVYINNWTLTGMVCIGYNQSGTCGGSKTCPASCTVYVRY